LDDELFPPVPAPPPSFFLSSRPFPNCNIYACDTCIGCPGYLQLSNHGSESTSCLPTFPHHTIFLSHDPLSPLPLSIPKLAGLFFISVWFIFVCSGSTFELSFISTTPFSLFRRPPPSPCPSFWLYDLVPRSDVGNDF